MTWIGTSPFQTTYIMKLKNHPAFFGETIIIWNFPIFWRKNPAIETVETYQIQLYGKLGSGWFHLSGFPGGDDERRMRMRPKKRCDDRKTNGGKGMEIGWFFGFRDPEGFLLPGAKQRFWLGEWVKLTEIDFN